MYFVPGNVNVKYQFEPGNGFPVCAVSFGFSRNNRKSAYMCFGSSTCVFVCVQCGGL